MNTPVADRYRNFADLVRHEPAGASWRIETVDRHDSNVLVIAPHGGRIEPGTSELAAAIAGEEYSLYCFEGIKRRGNRDLHITSHHFDEPMAIEIAGRSAIVLGIHGCTGDEAIHVGGLDRELVMLIADALGSANLPANVGDREFPAIHPQNICNRGSRLRGAQLEITRDLRSEEFRAVIARLVRVAILTHQTAIARQH